MRDSPVSTVELQALLDQRNERAYEELLEIAGVRLEQLTRTMLRNFPHVKRWEETDDVFQAAAFKLHCSLSEVRPETVRQFFGLAATQIRRTLIDLARHHYGPEGQGANHDSSPDNEPEAPSDAPETLASWAEFHEQVENLRTEEREVFQLLWYSARTQSETAALLSISERTVLRRYQRAKLSLRRSYFNDEENGD